ncbi:MAG: hypothetical protein IPP74_10275 [Alphaproteobacteria bacterium]|nr:hypothetical protein [Alphaproteobacteria bacterium]
MQLIFVIGFIGLVLFTLRHLPDINLDVAWHLQNKLRDWERTLKEKVDEKEKSCK